MKSLKRSDHELASAAVQLEVLEGQKSSQAGIPSFEEQLNKDGLYPLIPTAIDTIQINVGKMCNQVCKHCHVDAGPDRKEIMTRETMRDCLDAIDRSNFKTVDLTGGAPEMNPDFRWFIEELSFRGLHIIVRCNLTIILANPKYNDLPVFFKKHQIEVVSSLPYFNAGRTDAQRGEGVFGKSIKALEMLNEIGYGQEGSGLTLNLVYNPSGAFLPAAQEGLEKEFKQRLQSRFGISFNKLFTITNIPVSRFLEYLIRSGNYETYMQTLVDSYNAAAAANVMCRSMISVGWDGQVYDCDFNQMLELNSDVRDSHISRYDDKEYAIRSIKLGTHCFGCTAGAGSSCGGATAE